MAPPAALIVGFTLLAAALPAAPASAQLPTLPVPALPALPLPPITPPVTPPVVVPTLPPVPVVTDVLEDVLGTAGSDLPSDETVTGILDTIFGGGTSSSGGGTGGQTTTSGGSGFTGSGTTTGAGTGTQATTSGGTSTTPGSSTYGATSSNDGRAPRLSFKILSRLGKAAKTGKLRLRVTSSEVSVVAVNGLLRPGKARRVNGRPLHVSRRLVRTKVAVIAFRKKGARTLTITVPKRARKSLRNTQTARISLRAWASDVSRNQARRTVKRTIKR